MTRYEQKAQQLSKAALKKGLLGKLKREAEQSGCTVVAAVDTERSVPRVWKKRLIVNGHLCAVSHLRAPMIFIKDLRAYVTTHLDGAKRHFMAAIIVRVEVPRYKQATFVIPLKDLATLKSDALERTGRLHILIPIEDSLYSPRSTSVDWDQYKNAWHLLKE